MRDPDRIDPILERVREIWIAHPELRLGQILVNAISAVRPVDCPSVFYAEDDQVVEGLSRLTGGSANR